MESGSFPAAAGGALFCIYFSLLVCYTDSNLFIFPIWTAAGEIQKR